MWKTKASFLYAFINCFSINPVRLFISYTFIAQFLWSIDVFIWWVCSIYTAELRAIILALKHVYYSKGKSFLILSDSLSSLQSIFNLKYDHPVLVQILDLYTEMTRDGREIVFIWVPGQAGIRGNSAADSAAKDALDGDISVELIPFSDLKIKHK